MRTLQFKTSALALILTAAVGHTTADAQSYSVPPPLQLPPKPEQPEASKIDEQLSQRRTDMGESNTPKPPGTPGGVSGVDEGDDIPPIPRTGPLAINVEAVPINVFANEVFGNMLGLTVKIDPAVASLQELVTLNTSERLPPREMYLVARQVLADYGVAVRREGSVLRISAAPSGSSVLPPLVVSGRALPQVPVSHRPVFQLIELRAVTASDAARWLSTIYGTEIKVTEDSNRNSVLLSGKPEMIRQAVSTLEVFDRPTMRGRISVRLEPAFMSANDLATRLAEVLGVQGYSVARGANSSAAITLLPVISANTLLIFAADQSALDYAVQWARELDRASPTAGDRSMFYYQVRNTMASEVAAILNGQSGGAAANNSGPAGGEAPAVTAGAGQSAAAARQSAAAAPTPGGRILVDEPRNALIFQGDPADWERTLNLIRYLDRAPRQVMIEVTIAEVSLDNQLDYGVSWFAKNGFSRFNGKISSGNLPSSSGGSSGDNGSTSGSTGLSYLLDVAGQNRIALNAFAEDSRVTVLSRPHLLVKSGGEANIDVGTEVPTITMQTTSNQTTEGSSNLLQSIQYRKTGIITRIKPTVYSDSRVDLEINQEVSEVLRTGISIGGSPSIFNRSLSTSVSLRDGGSVVMAGLISERQTRGNGGVPLIKDIPIIGNLFKSTTNQRGRTELVIMIVPYIVETDEYAAAVSQAIIDSLDALDIPSRQPVKPLPGPIPSRPAPAVITQPVPPTRH